MTNRAKAILTESIVFFRAQSPEVQHRFFLHVKRELDRNKRGAEFGLSLDEDMVTAGRIFIRIVDKTTEV